MTRKKILLMMFLLSFQLCHYGCKKHSQAAKKFTLQERIEWTGGYYQHFIEHAPKSYLRDKIHRYKFSRAKAALKYLENAGNEYKPFAETAIFRQNKHNVWHEYFLQVTWFEVKEKVEGIKLILHSNAGDKVYKFPVLANFKINTPPDLSVKYICWIVVKPGDKCEKTPKIIHGSPVITLTKDFMDAKQLELSVYTSNGDESKPIDVFITHKDIFKPAHPSKPCTLQERIGWTRASCGNLIRSSKNVSPNIREMRQYEVRRAKAAIKYLDNVNDKSGPFAKVAVFRIDPGNAPHKYILLVSWLEVKTKAEGIKLILHSKAGNKAYKFPVLVNTRISIPPQGLSLEHICLIVVKQGDKCEKIPDITPGTPAITLTKDFINAKQLKLSVYTSNGQESEPIDVFITHNKKSFFNSDTMLHTTKEK